MSKDNPFPHEDWRVAPNTELGKQPAMTALSESVDIARELKQQVTINCKEISEEFEAYLKQASTQAQIDFKHCEHCDKGFYAGRRQAILEIMLWLKEH